MDILKSNLIDAIDLEINKLIFKKGGLYSWQTAEYNEYESQIQTLKKVRIRLQLFGFEILKFILQQKEK
jgi:hypothetical protein